MQGFFVSGLLKSKILYNHTMPTLLAIETSSDACSVAICHHEIVQEIFVIRPREHNKILLPMIDEILKGLRLGFADLDAIAFGAGPGSFTGLRLAAGVVQGLAFAAQKPVIPISSLAALAFSAAEQLNSPAPQTIITMLDARMQDVYFSAYRYEQASLVALSADELLPISKLQQRMENYHDAIVVGDSSLTDMAMPLVRRHEGTIYPHAKAVLALATTRFKAGEIVSAEQALPVYLRETVSWQKWQPKRGLQTTIPSI
jgi:tRNA threonylcarbamoyladenosine biosynthesis protein TsaB